MLSWIWHKVRSAIPKTAERVVVHAVPSVDAGAANVSDYLLRRGYEVTYLTDVNGSAPEGYKSLPKLSLRGMYRLLTASLVVSTHGTLRTTRRIRGQIMLNIWHGDPPLKPVGRYHGEVFPYADVAPVVGKVGQAYRCVEFGLPLQSVPVLGAARNDSLFQPASASALQVLGVSREQFAVWLPTYRETVRGAHQVDGLPGFAGLPITRSELLALDDSLDDAQFALLLKPHPLAANDLQDLELRNICFITDADLARAKTNLYRVLASSAALVTDISSVWLDYLLLQRPILFFFPDATEYLESRGVNIDHYHDWLPGPEVETGNLVDWLGRSLLAPWPHDKELRVLRSQLHRFHDGQSTDRLHSHLCLVGLNPSGRRRKVQGQQEGSGSTKPP